MTTDLSHSSGSALRGRMIEDMSLRGFTEDTRRDYIRCVKALAAFLGRPPDTATAEDLRRFQLHQTQVGMRPPGINSSVSALRFTSSSYVVVSGRTAIPGGRRSTCCDLR